MKEVPQGGFLIGMIQRVSGRIFAKKLKKYKIDINPAQGRILFVLWQKDSIPINELAKKTSMGKSTLTSMLDRLEKAGHIKREAPQKDRRTLLIKLTEKNKGLQSLYEQVSDEMNELFYKGFKEMEINEFENYLKRLVANLTEYERNFKD